MDGNGFEAWWVDRVRGTYEEDILIKDEADEVIAYVLRGENTESEKATLATAVKLALADRALANAKMAANLSCGHPESIESWREHAASCVSCNARLLVHDLHEEITVAWLESEGRHTA